MNILIIACLLGVSCRYDKEGKERPWVRELLEKHRVIPVCPEQLGGMPTPRDPVEWRQGRAVNNEGEDCTEKFLAGAAETWKLAKLYGCELAILKARSPSCGSHGIYDGSFQGRLTAGMGAAASLLASHGVRLMDEEEAERWLTKSDASDGF